jgi:histidinol-phosphate aminotransferase
LNKKAPALIRSEIAALSAYHVPDSGDLIKLDAMENPYQLPEKLLKEWLDILSRVSLNRYPDPSAAKLTKKLRAYMQVPEDQGSILGNGSDELIQIMAMAVAKPGRKILAPEPGFVMYKMIATFVGMDYVGVPLNEDFSLNLSATLVAVKQHQPALIFLAYPNNPTSNLFDEDAIVEIIKAAEGLVVVDEAYHPFACKSFMSRLGEFDNMVVMRTVSKMGLAGLRLGMLAGPTQWLKEFDKVRLPYNINVLTQTSASFAIDHADVFEQQAASIREQRELMFEELSLIDEIKAYPSKANFILMRLEKSDATQVFESLKGQGILIKNMSPQGGVLGQCLRVTVGSPEENKVFISSLKKALKN